MMKLVKSLTAIVCVCTALFLTGCDGSTIVVHDRPYHHPYRWHHHWRRGWVPGPHYRHHHRHWR